MNRSTRLLARLDRDDLGTITLEYLVLMTILGLGLIVGTHVVTTAINEEATELSQSITGLDQSWVADGYRSCSATKSGGFAINDPAGTIQGGSAEPGNGTTIDAQCCDGPDPPPGGDGDPNSQGYWKTHPDAWPVEQLTLGDQTYSQQEALDLLNAPSQGDASLILAKQLIAAKLNGASGADTSSIDSAISTADSLLSGYGGQLPYGVSPSTSEGQQMVDTASTLENFNSSP